MKKKRISAAREAARQRTIMIMHLKAIRKALERPALLTWTPVVYGTATTGPAMVQESATREPPESSARIAAQ